MEMKTFQAKLPDIHIQLSNEEAHELRQMLYEAQSYANDCGEVTMQHEAFIRAIETVLGVT